MTSPACGRLCDEARAEDRRRPPVRRSSGLERLALIIALMGETPYTPKGFAPRSQTPGGAVASRGRALNARAGVRAFAILAPDGPRPQANGAPDRGAERGTGARGRPGVHELQRRQPCAQPEPAATPGAPRAQLPADRSGGA